MDDKECTVLYKILTPAEKESISQKSWKGTALDLKDGFIHLSNSTQLPSTLDLFFSKESGVGDQLYLCLLPVKNLNKDELKFEGKERFGHIYGTIDPESDISETINIQRQTDTGKFHLDKLQF